MNGDAHLSVVTDTDRFRLRRIVMQTLQERLDEQHFHELCHKPIHLKHPAELSDAECATVWACVLSRDEEIPGLDPCEPMLMPEAQRELDELCLSLEATEASLENMLPDETPEGCELEHASKAARAEIVRLKANIGATKALGAVRAVSPAVGIAAQVAWGLLCQCRDDLATAEVKAKGADYLRTEDKREAERESALQQEMGVELVNHVRAHWDPETIRYELAIMLGQGSASYSTIVATLWSTEKFRKSGGKWDKTSQIQQFHSVTSQVNKKLKKEGMNLHIQKISGNLVVLKRGDQTPRQNKSPYNS